MTGKKRAAALAWQSVDPTKMSDDQLATAIKSTKAAINKLNSDINPLNQSLTVLLAVVSEKYGMEFPGLPPLGTVPYPTEFVEGYTYPEPDSEPVDSEPADA